MSETEIAEAIAQQEEHIKRSLSCGGRGTMLSHSWATFSAAPGGPTYEACWRAGCRVTRTDDDYQRKIGAKP